MGLLEHFDVKQNLLDFGCGHGRVISFLRTHGFEHVTGCDRSPRMCQFAELANPSNRIIRIESSDLSVLGQIFDGILLVGVLSSVIPYYERALLVKSLSRCITKGGKVIIGDFGCSSEAPYPQRYQSATIEPRTFTTEDGLLIHHFTALELTGLFARHFHIVEQRTFTVSTVHKRRIPGHVLVAQRS
jgi:SAM-dependent methyltransferase